MNEYMRNIKYIKGHTERRGEWHYCLRTYTEHVQVEAAERNRHQKVQMHKGYITVTELQQLLIQGGISKKM